MPWEDEEKKTRFAREFNRLWDSIARALDVVEGGITSRSRGEYVGKQLELAQAALEELWELMPTVLGEEPIAQAVVEELAVAGTLPTTAQADPQLRRDSKKKGRARRNGPENGSAQADPSEHTS